MSILTHFLLPALSIHIFLTFHPHTFLHYTLIVISFSLFLSLSQDYITAIISTASTLADNSYGDSKEESVSAFLMPIRLL